MSEVYEHKFFSFQEFKLLDEGDEAGTIEGYLSTFDNVDSDDDIVRKGAFKETLREWKHQKLMPSMFWIHDVSEPVGEWTTMAEDDHGLHVKGHLWVAADRVTEAVKKAYNVARSNASKGLSIGYRAVKWLIKETDEGRRVRELLKIKLYEGSIAPFAANELCSITAAKSLIRDGNISDPRDFERVLRDVGLSRSQAKAFMARGYAGLREADSEDSDMKALREAIAHLTNTYQKGT